jgi:saccharopine dehydrogenase-like NADP-dependent oxidoreductase
MKILVLGAGRVGSAIARDLAREDDFFVTVTDAAPEALRQFDADDAIATRRVDVTDDYELAEAVGDQELVIGAVPGHLGFATLEALIALGKDVVDISFCAEDPLQLDAAARDKGVTVAVDCGIAPGCGNLILGQMTTRLDRVERFECYVGGLPAVRTWPYEYKAVFSPIDVIEEYTRPSRYRRRGEEVVMPALSELELIDLPGVGTVEAFNTDGLRTLLRTVDVPDMKEKTLRYPGHAERMRMLRDSGFFSEEPIPVPTADGDRAAVRPIDLTARLLFPAWHLAEGEEDLTVMRVIVAGSEEGRAVRYQFDLLDHFDRATNTTSMARTTGYTCSGVARAVAEGLFRRPGVHPPETIGQDSASFERIFDHLASRGVVFERSRTFQEDRNEPDLATKES